MRVLYAGDSPIGGPANYLLGILKFLKADFRHLPPSKILKPGLLKEKYDAIVLSDFSRSRVPPVSQRLIAKQVSEGTGFLMIGGWASFSGPFGKWKGSLIEKILPVTLLGRDDRLNLPSGAWMTPSSQPSPPSRGRGKGEGEGTRPFFPPQWFKTPPVICGLNQLRPRQGSRVILTAKEIRTKHEHPLLILSTDPRFRTAALATDLAPHWAGGLVDWGKKRMKLPVQKGIWVEVGDYYVSFVSSLLRWLARDQ